MKHTVSIVTSLVVLGCATAPTSVGAGGESESPTAPPTQTIEESAPRPTNEVANRHAHRESANQPTPQPDESFLVWSEVDHEVTTHWISPRGGGFVERRHRLGSWVSVDDVEWEVVTSALEAELPSCNALLDGVGSDSDGRLSGDQLYARSKTGARLLYSPPTDAHEVETEVTEISVVGPYLLAEVHEWTDSCAAFPDERRELHAWDLRTFEAVDLAHDQRAAHRALLADAQSAIEGECEGPQHLGVSSFRPSFDGATLLGDYAVTITPSCDPYDEWTQESSHLRLKSPQLPTPLQPYAAIPSAARSFIASAPHATPRGITQPLHRKVPVAHRDAVAPPLG